jgi:hypothetical protein
MANAKVVITDALRTELGKYIAEHLVTKPNKAGTNEYLTIDESAQNVDNIGGYGFRINFGTMGMRPASEAAKSRVERATASIARLTDVEKAALLEELTK